MEKVTLYVSELGTPELQKIWGMVGAKRKGCYVRPDVFKQFTKGVYLPPENDKKLFIAFEFITPDQSLINSDMLAVVVDIETETVCGEIVQYERNLNDWSGNIYDQ